MVRIRLSPIVAGRAIDAPVELSWTRGEVVVDLEFLGGARLVHELSRTGSSDRTGKLRCIGDEQPMEMWNRAAEVFERGHLDGLSPDATSISSKSPRGCPGERSSAAFNGSARPLGTFLGRVFWGVRKGLVGPPRIAYRLGDDMVRYGRGAAIVCS